MGVVAKILISPKGDYDATTQYLVLDCVRYSNCAWLAKHEVIGVAPPSDPTITSNDWALLVRDGEYIGQYPTWDNVTQKPFLELDEATLDVVEGKLTVKTSSVTWSGVDNKPFDTLSDSFTTDDDELDIKIDGTTIYKDADGTIKANPSSAGFDIHSLQEETTLSNTDEFPFYDVSANGARKTLWSNIVAKLTALFTKAYDSQGNIVMSSTIKDTLRDINDNASSNQLAGALAVKDIYKDIAPIPTSAPQYSTTKAYAKGDTCSYSGVIYRCISPVTSGSQFDATKWTAWNDNQEIKFGVDADGNYGYYKVGADSVTPFKSGSSGSLTRSVVGSFSSSGASWNIASKFPDVDLNNVTQGNFAVVPTGGISNSDWGLNQSVFDHSIRPRARLNVGIPSMSYNASTHVLSVSPAIAKAEGKGSNSSYGDSSTATQTGYITYTVYFYHL